MFVCTLDKVWYNEMEVYAKLGLVTTGGKMEVYLPLQLLTTQEKPSTITNSKNIAYCGVLGQVLHNFCDNFVIVFLRRSVYNLKGFYTN